MSMEQKIRAIMKATGWKQQKVAEHFDVSQSTVNRWLNGSEPEGHRRDAINAAFDSLVDAPKSTADGMHIPVMGNVGAGAEVEPDFDQVPPDGIDQVYVPFHVPDDLVAFTVVGTSMLPYMREGTIIIVYREQQRPIEAFYGLQAAVRTSDGRRFIKTITRGSNGGVNLISWNAEEMYDVHLEWIGEIFAILPPSAARKVERQGGIQGQLKLRT